MYNINKKRLIVEAFLKNQALFYKKLLKNNEPGLIYYLYRQKVIKAPLSWLQDHLQHPDRRHIAYAYYPQRRGDSRYLRNLYLYRV